MQLTQFSDHISQTSFHYHKRFMIHFKWILISVAPNFLKIVKENLG